MFCKEELLNSLPERFKTTLSTVVYRYKSGDPHAYFRSGKHKASASSDWYEYANVITEYPRPLWKQEHQFTIVDLACGIRNEEDKLILVREVSIDEFAGYMSGYNEDDWEWKSRYNNGDRMFYDEEADKFLHFYTMDLYMSYIEDQAFINFWLSSVEELIEKRNLNEGHSDNAIRKLLRRHANRKYYEECLEKEGKGGEEYTMCGRCYKRRCCCSGSSKELTYEINVHSNSVEISKGFRTIDLDMEEVAELASFFATAKTKIKEAKIAELEAQAEELKKRLEEAKAL